MEAISREWIDITKTNHLHSYQAQACVCLVLFLAKLYKSVVDQNIKFLPR